MSATNRISVIDSHTAGEPTRVVVSGGPDLGAGPLVERRARFATEFDHYRSAIAMEPRGSDVLVGALLVEPHEPNCDAGVIFFNNAGMLGMCGHGTIGLVETLVHLGRYAEGVCRIDTPVGVVEATRRKDGMVAIRNVPSFRHAKGVSVQVEGVGEVIGDVAYGGNWFFLVTNLSEQMDMTQCDRLTDLTWRIRLALERDGVTGADGAEIDHVELFAPTPTADSRNFVLCPGKAYDRSPCGTGTSAKVACLAADGKLAPGQIWRQESVCGGVFEASYEVVDGHVIPTIAGRAHITAESTLILDPDDPYAWGLT